MRLENYGWNTLAPRVFNTAITPQHASLMSREKMDYREYHMPQEFGDDLKLMFNNCYRYNQPEHDVFVMAKTLETVFDTRYAKLPIDPSVKVVRSSSTKSDCSISGLSSKPSNDAEDSEEERHNKKLNTLEKRIMSLQEEVFKLSEEMKRSRKEKKKQINKKKNKTLVPNNCNSGMIFVQRVQKSCQNYNC